MGMKKSVVATIAWLSLMRYTAASSLVSVPTSRSEYGKVAGIAAKTRANISGAILQPQPPPWEYCVRRIISFGFSIDGAFLEKYRRCYRSTAGRV